MILASILIATQAHASCLDEMESFVQESCISVPEIFEHRAGVTQVYVCDITPGTPAAVAMFSYDPDISEVVQLSPESCAGGSLFLDRDPSDLSLLLDWSRYTDLIESE